MRGYFAFSKKEFLENMLNYRLLILLIVFLIFGMLSPFIAKFTPELIAAFAPDMQILNMEPTAFNSWEQFYKNISGVGFSAFIILFGSLLANEYAKGTLILMLTKGMSRSAVIFSKFTVSAVMISICYWISFAVSFGYTKYLWQDITLPNTVFAAFFLWIIGFMYLGILMFGCVLFKQTFTSILFTGGIIAVMSLFGTLKQMKRFNPFILTTKNIDLLSGTAVISEFTIPAIVAIIIALAFLIASVILFNKKQL